MKTTTAIHQTITGNYLVLKGTRLVHQLPIAAVWPTCCDADLPAQSTMKNQKCCWVRLHLLFPLLWSFWFLCDEVYSGVDTHHAAGIGADRWAWWLISTCAAMAKKKCSSYLLFDCSTVNIMQNELQLSIKKWQPNKTVISQLVFINTDRTTIQSLQLEISACLLHQSSSGQLVSCTHPLYHFLCLTVTQ